MIDLGDAEVVALVELQLNASGRILRTAVRHNSWGVWVIKERWMMERARIAGYKGWWNQGCGNEGLGPSEFYQIFDLCFSRFLMSLNHGFLL